MTSWAIIPVHKITKTEVRKHSGISLTMVVCFELPIQKAKSLAKHDLEVLYGRKIQDFTFFFLPPPPFHRKQTETFRIPISLELEFPILQ